MHVYIRERRARARDIPLQRFGERTSQLRQTRPPLDPPSPPPRRRATVCVCHLQVAGGDPLAVAMIIRQPSGQSRVWREGGKFCRLRALSKNLSNVYVDIVIFYYDCRVYAMTINHIILL